MTVVEIEKILVKEFSPVKIQVIDNSHQHSGHYDVPDSGVSHLSVKIVSDKFDGLSKIQRHKLVYRVLQGAWSTTLHALEISALTSVELSNE